MGATISKEQQLEIDKYNKKIEKIKKVRNIVMIILQIIIMIIYFFGISFFIAGIFIYFIIDTIFEMIQNHYRECIDNIYVKHRPDKIQNEMKKFNKEFIRSAFISKLKAKIILAIVFSISYAGLVYAGKDFYDTFGLYSFIIAPIFLAIVISLTIVLFKKCYKAKSSENVEEKEYTYKVEYSRESVCAGDDVDPSPIDIWLEDNSTIEELVEKILATKRRVALYGPYGRSTHWVFHSSAGDLADITLAKWYTNIISTKWWTTGKREQWDIKYLKYPKKYLVKDLKIDSVYGERAYSKK